jgi:hypothetical protein
MEKMKTRFATGFALAVGLGLAGAVNAADKAKPAPTVTLASVKFELQQLDGLIAGAMTALNKVEQAAETSKPLQGPFSEFEKVVKTLKEKREKVRTQSLAAKVRVKDHYEAWLKESDSLSNPKLRDKAKNRLGKSKKEFNKIIAAGEDAKASFTPFVSDLSDVYGFLSFDLSNDSVDDLGSTIRKLRSGTKKVRGDISDVIEQIDRTLKITPKL